MLANARAGREATATESIEITTDVRTIRLDELTEMLSPSLEEKDVWSAVLEAVEELNVFGYEISVDDALAVLARVAERPGLLGTSARFCRSRLMLNRDSSDA